jgi:hypothetical protein
MDFCFCLRGCNFYLEDVVSVGLGYVMVVHMCECDRLSTCFSPGWDHFLFRESFAISGKFVLRTGGHSGRLTGAMAPRSNVHV